MPTAFLDCPATRKTELDIMRTIKRALDPQNIMNPGKVLRV